MKRIPSLLIVDDSPEDCYLASHRFQRSGGVVSCWSIHDPREVLDFYRNFEQTRAERPAEFPPTVILLDINMPGMTGFELADALARAHQVDICMVSSSIHERDVARAESHPLVRSYYEKPLDARDVAKLVDTYGQEGR